MVFCSLMASSAIRAFISALKLRRCLDFIFTRFPRQRFYTLMSGPNFGEHFSDRLLERRRKQAQFRDPQVTLDNFDFTFNPKMNRSLIFDLATAAFIARHE